MEPLFYHYGYRHEKPVVTVCLVKKGRQFGRGLALCSKLDYPNNSVGTVKAQGRAIKAITRKANDLPIDRDEAIRLLFEADAPPFKFKAEFPAKLTTYEKELYAIT